MRLFIDGTAYCCVTFIAREKISAQKLKVSPRIERRFDPLNNEINPICHLLALLRAHLIFHVNRRGVKVSAISRKSRKSVADRLVKDFKNFQPYVTTKT
jgi:hypothetical protein